MVEIHKLHLGKTVTIIKNMDADVFQHLGMILSSNLAAFQRNNFLWKNSVNSTLNANFVFSDESVSFAVPSEYTQFCIDNLHIT